MNAGFVLIALLCWVFPPTLADQSTNTNLLLPGQIDREMLAANVPSVIWSDPADRLRLISDEEGSSFLRVSYPAGGWGPDKSGAQILFDLPPAETRTAEYRVRFAKDFEFVSGGKLPGLAGGTATTGGRRPNGDGWSARLMWRRGGNAVLYLYHLDQRGKFGEDIPMGVKFQPGVWHQIRQRVTVNHDGKIDGQIEIWFDGTKVLDAKQLRLRDGDQALVDRFYFSTFFGGSDRRWAPKEDQIIDFADFKAN